jgi:hypothetical protein
MVNLQLIDSFEGGYLALQRNNYPQDRGVYSELYACLFGTSSSKWWGDGAFNVESENVTSRTENALKTHNSNSQADINLIKKAVEDDLLRFTTKNPEIQVQNISLAIYNNKAIEIIIELSGNSDTFNFIWQKTKESLENITPKIV